MNSATLFTIGYQGASIDGFIATLKQAGVSLLIDVRFAPFSGRPEFRQTALRQALEESGLAYAHLKPLGNPPASRDAAKAGERETYHRLFQAHLDTPEAGVALEEARQLALQGPVALMCLERDPKDCHRLMVAERLATLAPLQIEHLSPAEKTPEDQPRLL